MDFASNGLDVNRVRRKDALPPRANTRTLLNGASTGKGKTHVANDAASVRGDCIVCSGRSLANHHFRTSIQSGKWWNHGGQQYRVCRSRRTGRQNVWPRPGWGTIQFKQSGAISSPAGQTKSIQALSSRQPYFASRSSFSPEQLNPPSAIAASTLLHRRPFEHNKKSWREDG